MNNLNVDHRPSGNDDFILVTKKVICDQYNLISLSLHWIFP